MTDQTALITGQTYNTNTWEFATNYFQVYDLPLAIGTNIVTFHASDLAGNITTLATNIICVAATNAPVATLLWPLDGMLAPEALPSKDK